jgi:hypothetical protein
LQLRSRRTRQLLHQEFTDLRQPLPDIGCPVKELVSLRAAGWSKHQFQVLACGQIALRHLAHQRRAKVAIVLGIDPQLGHTAGGGKAGHGLEQLRLAANRGFLTHLRL